MNLRIIGCCSGLPSPHVAHSCYLVEEKESKIMLDCGGGSTSALLRCGIDCHEISGLFISHTHPDHVSDIPILIQLMHLKKRSKPLEVYVPSEFRSLLRAMLAGMYLLEERLGFELDIRGVTEDDMVSVGPFRVTPLRTNHLKSYKDFLAKRDDLENRMDCFGYVVHAGDRKLVYSADLRDASDLRRLVEGVDLILTEAMHVELQELAGIVAESKAEACVLTHLPEKFDEARAAELFRKNGVANLRIASEGLCLPV